MRSIPGVETRNAQTIIAEIGTDMSVFPTAGHLPFRDGELDVVTSLFGAMFAPDHQTVSDELLRVCLPGGTIGMINFTPEALGGEFGLFARHAPAPPPGALPPNLWESEGHVYELFGDPVESLETTRHEYVKRAATLHAYVDLFKNAFGPPIAPRLPRRPARSRSGARL